MKSTYDWLEAADFIGWHKEVIQAAQDCGADYWKVVQVSKRKSALFTGQSSFLIPGEDIILKAYPEP